MRGRNQRLQWPITSPKLWGSWESSRSAMALFKVNNSVAVLVVALVALQLFHATQVAGIRLLPSACENGSTLRLPSAGLPSPISAVEDTRKSINPQEAVGDSADMTTTTPPRLHFKLNAQGLRNRFPPSPEGNSSPGTTNPWGSHAVVQQVKTAGRSMALALRLQLGAFACCLQEFPPGRKIVHLVVRCKWKKITTFQSSFSSQHSGLVQKQVGIILVGWVNYVPL